MTTRLSIISDGAPMASCTLDKFLEANEFDYEDVTDLVVHGRPMIFGGGAAPWMAVKLAAPGDEHLTIDTMPWR